MKYILLLFVFGKLFNGYSQNTFNKEDLSVKITQTKYCLVITHPTGGCKNFLFLDSNLMGYYYSGTIDSINNFLILYSHKFNPKNKNKKTLSKELKKIVSANKFKLTHADDAYRYELFVDGKKAMSTDVMDATILVKTFNLIRRYIPLNEAARCQIYSQ